MKTGAVLIFHKEEDAILFEAIIIALKARYTLVSISELETLLLQKKSLKNIIHISFDDGERSFYEIVFPVLKKHQVAVSLFISPEVIAENKNYWFQETADYDTALMYKIVAGQMGIPVADISSFSYQSLFKCLTIGQINSVIAAYQQLTQCGKKNPQNISVEQLKEMQASGLVTFGAHTLHHPILINEDAESAEAEIKGSIGQLEKLIGQPVKYFAYPNGRPQLDFGEREMNYLKQNNIVLGFATTYDNLGPETNLLSIPRMSFAMMGLAPYHPLVHLRLSLGKRWINWGQIGKPSEKEMRKRMKKALGLA